MTEHILSSGVATSLGVLLVDEIEANERGVDNYVHDWQQSDIDVIKPILAAEKACLAGAYLFGKNDSVKGEDAMLCVYRAAGENKATDAITLKESRALSLIEAKFLIKFGGKGPFGGRGSFRERISDKFYEMERQMIPDGETIDSLRILVVTEEQLPYSINHVRAFVDGDYPPGDFSGDGKKHRYVLCSSTSLKMMIENPPVGKPDAANYLFFTI